MGDVGVMIRTGVSAMMNDGQGRRQKRDDREKNRGVDCGMLETVEEKGTVAAPASLQRKDGRDMKGGRTAGSASQAAHGSNETHKPRRDDRRKEHSHKSRLVQQTMLRLSMSTRRAAMELGHCD